ncbi:two-component system response regulator OmpR [Paraperlucidibaca wandonensis]|jgi:two-component system phosphate regulon response regulator OmpR|uniref:Two-component system response regulator OmpR n=1 Tax=Paraperlucidibaca wandonensis TaxID=1268273 RepID=A0ABW3HJ06_9GAMM|nr:two-component system response regulator OmpR [Paraperlucidibaca sp.]MBQ0723494.1 two-component system response regulator OmpR [Paraperlucidibaca sp.]MBQ0842619.1 two-component system response regulator OmpR [Paraperlucidibaca sp.]|tara:strand:- start:2394 stop:3122 length:729 start_codon:yes stop_codon:yes gene_type:complete
MNSDNRDAQKILVVDDDVRLRTLLQRFLEDQGYGVKTVADAVQMDRVLGRELFALIVLDFMLPGEDGIAICHRLRESGNNTPIIMLTARGADSDRINGLEAGADDYLQKPFNPQELLARMKAVLRRQTRELPGAPSQTSEVVSFGPWTLDLSTRQLSNTGTSVSLTTGEFAVLKALVQHPREPLTRDKLMALARGREWGAMERSIDVQVSRLRKLIETNPANARYIQTVWGVGYVFVPDELI